MTPTEQAKILRDAAARVQRGWCRGHLTANEAGDAAVPPEATRFCLVGALMVVCDRSSALVTRPHREGLFDTLRRLTGIEGSLSAWNDAPERTQEEVVAVLEAAAARLEGEA